MGMDIMVPVRALELILSIIVLGLDFSLVSQLKNGYTWDGLVFTVTSDAPGNFVIFVAFWTIVFASYLLLVCTYFGDSIAAHPIAVLVIEFMSWVFWLAAWAVFANITNDWREVPEWPLNSKVEAILAFALATWVAYCVSLGYTAFVAFRGRRGKSSAV